MGHPDALPGGRIRWGLAVLMIDFEKGVSLEQVSLRLNVPLTCEVLYSMWLVKSPKVVKGEGWLKALVLPILREVLHVRILVLDLTDVLEDNL